MKITASAVLRQDKVNAHNEAPVCIRITADRKTTYKTLFRIPITDWDAKSKEVRKTATNAGVLNLKLKTALAEYTKTAYMCDVENADAGITAIRDKIHQSCSLDLFQYAETYVQRLAEVGKFAHHAKVSSTMERFQKFIGRTTFPVNALTEKTLKDYEYHLATVRKNKPNTIAANMKIIGKLVNDLYKEYRLDNTLNPFTYYKKRYVPVERVFLDETEVAAIENLKIRPTNYLYDIRNIFLFEIYTGLRISDILTLKWKNFDGKRLHKTIKKTKKTIHLPLQDKAIELIEIRKRCVLRRFEINPEDYIFPYLAYDYEQVPAKTIFTAISTTTARINKALKRIKEKAQIEKSFSTHTGRHTFSAIFLLKCNGNYYALKEFLGHGDMKTTQTYAHMLDKSKDDIIEQLNTPTSHEVRC